METKLPYADLDSPRSAPSTGGGGMPGKRSMTQGMAPRTVIYRAADGTRDANGVAADAETAVARASGGSGAPLPTRVQRQFEQSLGTDLSSVRVHTGAESAQAASAVGAKAYTVGNDIHFADGRYQPDDPFGLHLLAHEVAHTAQQSGGAQRRQHKLEVSAPQDAAEHEADRAADAMVRGEAASVSGAAAGAVARDPDPDKASYANRSGDEPPKSGEEQQGEWEGRVAMAGDDLVQFTTKKMKVVTTVMGVVGKVSGIKNPLSPSLIFADNWGQYEADIWGLECQLKFIAQNNDNDDSTRNSVGRSKEDIEKELKHKKEKASSVAMQYVVSGFQICSGVNSVLGDAAGYAGMILGQVAGFESKLFKGVSDFSSKADTVLKMCDTLARIADTTALTAFQANPNLDSAELWAAHVGEIFTSASALASGIPLPGWGTVVTGLLNMPAKVGSAFAGVVRSHYEKIDRLTRVPGRAEFIPDGKVGRHSEVMPTR